MKEADTKKPNKNEQYKNADAPFYGDAFEKAMDFLLVMKLVSYYREMQATKENSSRKWNQADFLAWIKATLEAGDPKKKTK